MLLPGVLAVIAVTSQCILAVSQVQSPYRPTHSLPDVRYRHPLLSLYCPTLSDADIQYQHTHPTLYYARIVLYTRYQMSCTNMHYIHTRCPVLSPLVYCQIRSGLTASVPVSYPDLVNRITCNRLPSEIVVPRYTFSPLQRSTTRHVQYNQARCSSTKRRCSGGCTAKRVAGTDAVVPGAFGLYQDAHEHLERVSHPSLRHDVLRYLPPPPSLLFFNPPLPEMK